MEIKGKISRFLTLQGGTSKAGKQWQKATAIVTYGNDQYPKQVAIDNFKNATEFNNLPLGVEITFHVDAESREFNGKFYTSITCYKWEMLTQAPQQAAPIAPPQPADIQGADDSPF